MIQYYVECRLQDDSEKRAYKFTVRQLESMIRLSEALARVHMDEKITTGYVREAARLLKKSIITVDQGNVDFDEDEDEEQVENKMEVDEEEGEEKFSITYEEYIKTARAITYRIRREDEGEGVKQSIMEDLVIKDSYTENELEGEDALLKASAKLTFVIKRLIEVDNILLIRSNAEEERERFLEVHPNYDPDSRYEIADRKAREQKKGPKKKKKNCKSCSRKTR